MPQYDQEELAKFKLSGKILRETREEMKGFVHENMPIIEVCEKAEGLIRQKGGQPAFPCNVSINEVAAHYTSPPGDKSTIPPKSIVKVDIGVHVDGYVTDTAFTACFNPEFRTMVETAQTALKAAIEAMSSDVSTGKIGGIIENTIKNRGFRPIQNLTGHSVGRYLIHAGTSIPNVHQVTFTKFKVGDVFAIEPFVTVLEAGGAVEDYPQKTIFRLQKPKSAKTPNAKKLLKYIEENFHTLPFAERWLQGVLHREQHVDAMKELLATKGIMGYPVFVEVTRKTVAQAEHTVLVKEEGCEVLT
ncbi:MAG TPA: type II methionyl aminopeptidase [Candidatus Nanoarchaeia archaeon]|nr:type II methionyl aminopeptidase [Candidatus Nanoarchaeia archaeon]